MTTVRQRVVTVLAWIGWYAIWSWLIALPFWGWEMPWEVFRAPMSASIAGLTGWPLWAWIEHQPDRPGEP